LLQEALAPPAGSDAGLFGRSVGLQKGTGIVGAPADLTAVTIDGYAFMYRFGFNVAPVLLRTVDDQYAEAGVPFLYAFPKNVFYDPDLEDALTLSASYGGVTNWLTFDGTNFAGTTFTSGTTWVTVVAQDLSGASTSVVFRVMVSPYTLLRDQWDADAFGPAVTNITLENALWGGSANPDGDNMNNDQEYAFGGDAMVADASPIQLAIESPTVHVITYVRRYNDPAIQFNLLGSVDMISWANLGALVLDETRTPLDTELETVEVRLLVESGFDVRFYRVEAIW
jgi:hypothetical protein